MKAILTIILFASGMYLSAQDNRNKDAINDQLENWHLAASEADYETYFDLMTADAIFIGTDADENWENEEFRSFSKPYFDRGKAWSFSTLERNIYLHKSKELAWFDELLDTQMGICRGSGVVVLEDGSWKVKHYVLSIAVPNEDVEALTAMKKEHDSLLMKELREN